MALGSILGGSAGREYVLKIVADVRDAVRGVDEVATKTTTMKDRMIGIGKSVAAGMAVGAVVQFGRASVQSAAEADDAMDAVASVYGKAGDAVVSFSETTAEKMGLSAQDYQMLAAQAGQALTNLGISQDDAAGRTQDLAQRAADVSAIFGGDVNTAMDAFTKAMMGQTRGLKQYGISIEATEVEARAMAKGYVDASGEVTAAGKAIATQELILEETSKQAGAYAENSKDLGSQQDIMRAKMENLQTTIGNQLLPIIVKLMEVLGPMLTFIAENINWIGPLVAGIGAIVVAIKIWTVAQAAFNLVMLANPVVLIVAAVIAFIAVLVLAYQKVDWFREFVDKALDAVVNSFKWLWEWVEKIFNWIKENWPLLLGILTGPFGAAVALIIKNWDTIKEWFGRLPELLRQAVSTIFDIITSPFRKAWDFIRDIPEKIAGGFFRLVGKIESMFGNVADAIVSPFRTAFNAIKWLWNHTVGGFHISIPSWVPIMGGKEWTIPKMATGGIVTRPTIALIGEAGPEAVIPLSQMSSTSTVASTPIIYNVNVYALNANAETGRLVAESLREYNRTVGAAV